MFESIVLTDIYRVIFVAGQEYPERVTNFGRNLPSQELVYNISGSGTVYYNDAVLKTSAGTVRYLPGGPNNRYQVERDVLGDCIDICFQADRPLRKEAFVQKVSDSKEVEALFQRAFCAWVRQDSRSRLEVLACLYSILSHLEQERHAPTSKFRPIQPAVEYLNSHFLTREITYETLAAVCGISTSYLKRLFAEQFGMAPRQYVIRMRLNYAADLLREGSLSVGQVAELSGFREIYYFSRSFKAHFGLTPTQFREKYISSK